MLSISELLNPITSNSSPSNPRSVARAAPSDLSTSPSTAPNLHYHREEKVRITRQTTLHRLYHYKANVLVEYPETHETETIGHLFEQDVEWIKPWNGFVYSLGRPSGQTKATERHFCDVLVDVEGNKVPCRVLFWTCMSLS